MKALLAAGGMSVVGPWANGSPIFLQRERPVLWPFTSVSQFGPCPLLAEPDIAICRLLLAVDHGPSGGPW